MGGVSFNVLEASDRVGGRVQRIPSDFGEDPNGIGFPVDIGGEWLHGEPSLLDEIVQDSVEWSDLFEVIDWQPISYRYDENDADNPWTSSQCGGTDHKFVNRTWYDFFETFIMTPEVMDSVVLGCGVTTIDYSERSSVAVECGDGRSFRARQVVLTVPVPILRDDITFVPGLPDDYRIAVDSLGMKPGIKVNLQFATKFYYNAFTIEPYDDSAENGRFFHNPFVGQDETTTANIMTIEILGEFARQYIDLTDDEIVDIMLDDLDRVFAADADSRSVATDNLVASFVQNWSAQPFTRGAYSGSNWPAIDVLREPLEDGRLIFAGEAIPYDGCDYEWGYIHGAARSGRAAAAMVNTGLLSRWWSV